MTSADYLLSTRGLRHSGYVYGFVKTCRLHRLIHWNLDPDPVNECKFGQGKSYTHGEHEACRQIALNTERANAVITNLNTGNQP